MKTKHLLLSVFFAFAAVSATAADERVLKWLDGYQPLKFEALERVLQEKTKADNVVILFMYDERNDGKRGDLFFDLEIFKDSKSYRLRECHMEVLPFKPNYVNPNIFKFDRCAGSLLNEEQDVRVDVEITSFYISERDFGDQLQRVEIRKIIFPPDEDHLFPEEANSD